MPLYEYRCPECGERFEEIRSFGQAEDGVECVACGAEGAERQISSFATAPGGSGGGRGACGPRPGRGFT